MSELALALVGLALAVATLGLAVILPIVSLLRTSRALREAERAHGRIEALARVVQDLARERREAGVQSAAVAEAGQEPPSERAVPVVETGARPAPMPPTSPGASAAGTAPLGPAAAGFDPAIAAAQGGGAPVMPSPAVALAPGHAQPSPGAPPRRPHAVPAPPPLPHPHGPSLEQRIGKRWLLYVGIAAIVLGASYLVKLAFDNNWITPAMRVALSALGGGVLVAIGLRFADRGLAAFGQLLAGGGIAVLYVAIYAALHLYDLVGRGTAFAAMTAVTAFGAWLADRRVAPGLAMVALLGGFATPWLVGGDRDAYLALFTYVTVLGAGAAVLARRHAWPTITLAGFVLTALTFGSWAASNYRDDRYLVVQGFMTAWLVLLLAAITGGSPPGERDAPETPEPPRPGSAGALQAGVGAIVGLVAPAAYHAASLSNLARHTQALLIYFILVTLAAVLYAADGRRAWARLVGWLAAWLPFLGWLSQRSSAAGSRVTLLALFGLHLLAELRTLARDRARLDGSDVLLLHLNGLGLLAGLLLSFPRWDTHGMAAAVAGVGAGYALLAVALRARHDTAPLHYAALAAACAAGALALRFEGAWVTVGWAIDGACLAWLGLRERRQWLRAGGGVLLALAAWHGLEALGRDTGVARHAFLNASVLSVLGIAGLLAWVARRYARAGRDLPRGASAPIAVCLLGAAVLVLLVVTSEINRLYGVYAWRRDVEAGPMAGGAADLARQVTLSIVWAAYGVVLVAAGIARRYAPIRYLAITLLAGTIGKVFFVDLAQLDRVYRVLSVIGLGVLLIVASYLYQRFLTDEDEPPAADPPDPSRATGTGPSDSAGPDREQA